MKSTHRQAARAKRQTLPKFWRPALSADVARCPGVGSDAEGWREGCETCLRRTAAPTDHPWVSHIKPPAIIAFECEHLLEPKE